MPKIHLSPDVSKLRNNLSIYNYVGDKITQLLQFCLTTSKVTLSLLVTPSKLATPPHAAPCTYPSENKSQSSHISPNFDSFPRDHITKVTIFSNTIPLSENPTLINS